MMKRWLWAAAALSSPLAANPETIDDLIEPIRAKYNVPGMAAAFLRDGEIVAQGAAGVRKLGAPERVTVGDRFHIGSNTKSMTATLAAMLVEDGHVTWKTTLAEGFPALAGQMQPEWRAVTLEQLLSHQGGTPANLDENGLWGRLWGNAGIPPRDQRLVLTRELLSKSKPVAPPGTKYVYSNAGYAIAGHLLETREQARWEDLMRTRLFAPLGMTAAGFGAPGTASRVEEPWGHATDASGQPKPVTPGRSADNPPAIGPAGTVNCSTLDLLRYLQFHLRGERGEATGLLRPASFKELHTAHFPPSNYAFGWGLDSWRGVRGHNFGHAGSNTYFFCQMFFAPAENMAIVVNANWASPAAQKAVGEVIDVLTKRYQPTPAVR